jgi:hypothetical protein
MPSAALTDALRKSESVTTPVSVDRTQPAACNYRKTQFLNEPYRWWILGRYLHIFCQCALGRVCLALSPHHYAKNESHANI